MENWKPEEAQQQQREVIPLLMRVDEGWVDSIRNPSQFADPGLERWASQSSNPHTSVLCYFKNRNGGGSAQLWVYRNGSVKKLQDARNLYMIDQRRVEHVRFLCTDRCVLSINAIEQALNQHQLEYDIVKLDVVRENSHWEVMPRLICPNRLEALCSDSDARKTYLWGAPRVEAQYVPSDVMADGDGLRQVSTFIDLNGWTVWSHNDNDSDVDEEQEEQMWERANPSPCRRINEDFPNRPPKYLEITNYFDFSKTTVVESLYKRFQLTHYALSYNPRRWARESQRVGDILIFQDHKSPHPVTSLYTMSQIVPRRPMLEETIDKAELPNGWSVRPNVEDWDAFRQKWRPCIAKNTAEKSAMKLFWDAQRNTQQDEWPDRPVYRWEREFSLPSGESTGPTYDVAEDLEIFVTQQGPIYVYGFIGEQTYSTRDPKKERVVGSNFHSRFQFGQYRFYPIGLNVTDENGNDWTVLSSGSTQECLDQTTFPWES